MRSTHMRPRWVRIAKWCGGALLNASSRPKKSYPAASFAARIVSMVQMRAVSFNPKVPMLAAFLARRATGRTRVNPLAAREMM